MPFVWVDNGIYTRYNPNVSLNKVKKVHSLEQSSEIEEHLNEKQVDREAPEKEALPELNPYKQVQKNLEKSEKQEAFFARQIMTHNVISLNPDAKLDKARELLKKNQIRHIPVVDSLNHLVGIASESDILNGIIETSTSAELNEYMSKKVLTAKPDTWIQDIAKIMVEEKIGCMPVMSDSGKLLGMVTRTDILSTIIYNPHLDLFV